MKKVAAIFIAIVLVFGFTACAKTATTTSPSLPPEESNASAPATAVESASAPEASASIDASSSGTYQGYYEDDVDHYARETYTLCYAMPAETSMHNGFMTGFKQLEKKFNVEVVSSNANNNNDMFIQNLEIMAPKVDGFFVDSQYAIHNRVKEVLTELNKPYVAFLEGLFDDDFKVNAPAVIQNGIQTGAVQADWFAENYKKIWGDIDVTQICVVSIISSTYDEFANRGKGAVDQFKKLFPDNTMFQQIDMTGKGMSADAAYQMVTPVITTQPDIKYWYITSATDVWAQGATRAVEAANMDKNTIVTANGNDVLYKEWDSGYDGCWKAVSTYANLELCAPAVAGLVALLDGRASFDTIWKELARPGDPYGDKYGIFYVDNNMVTKDDYMVYESNVAKKLGLG